MTVKPQAEAVRGASPARLILASASKTRVRLLENAGVSFEAEAANVDEAALKEALAAERSSGRDAALALAEMKAMRVSASRPGAVVLGCDQLLDCAGIWFDKAIDRADAARQLALLQGKAHELATAVVAVRDGRRLWHHVEAPRLVMRALSEADIAAYLDAAGDEPVGCVGGYRLEGHGVHLFARVEGDYFAILGLPLLPLLDFLRGQALASW